MNEKQKEILDKMEPGIWYTAYDLYTNIKTMLVLLREEKVRTDRGESEMTKHMEQGLEFENEDQSAQDEFDYMRVREWALNDTRRANIAFTAGANRNVAYLIEELRLKCASVPVIEGLDEALKKYSFDMPDISDYEYVGHYLNDEAEYRKASSIVEKAARAYAELQKGV